MEKLQLSAFAKYLQPRPRDFDKGKAGHVLIVGGNKGFMGAVCLAGEAALRVRWLGERGNTPRACADSECVASGNHESWCESCCRFRAVIT